MANQNWRCSIVHRVSPRKDSHAHNAEKYEQPDAHFQGLANIDQVIEAARRA